MTICAIITDSAVMAHTPDTVKVSGIVRDPNGVPLQGVEFLSLHYRYQYPVSDADGKFSFGFHIPTIVLGRGPLRLTAFHREKQLAKDVQIHGENLHLDITLEPAVWITGKVVDPKNIPVEKARVRMDVGHRRYSLTTDSKGIFTSRPLVDTEIHSISLGIEHERLFLYEPDWEIIKKVDGIIDLGVFFLSAAEKSVAGVVFDVTGKPVANADVRSSGPNQPSRRAQTDEHGKFTLDHLVYDQVQISVIFKTANGNMRVETHTHSGDENVEIKLSGTQHVAIPEPQIESLQGKVCPDMSELGVEVEIDGRALAVCFVDVGQRVSRRFLSELADIYTSADDSMQIIVVQIEGIDEDMFSQLAGGYPFEIALPAVDNYTELQAKWGVTALPWVILADSEHVVTAEGVSASQLRELFD